MDMNLVLWIWSTRTRTQTKVLVLVLTHFFSTRTHTRTHAKQSTRTRTQDLCTRPNPAYRVFDHEKTHPKFSKKIWQKKVSNRIPPKSNQVRRPERYSYQVLQWLVEWFSLYPADNQIFVHQCHSCDLGSRSQECHPVHFPRPTVKSLI